MSIEPATIVTAEQVLQEYESLTPSSEGRDRVVRIVSDHPEWQADRLRLSDVSFSFECVAHPSSRRQIRKYAHLRSKAPRIIVELGIDGRFEIVDGFHRVAAALLRGETAIETYRPVDADSSGAA